MQVSFSTIRSDKTTAYTSNGETITVTCGGAQESYDFTNLPDGKAESIDQGALPFACVLKAERVDGELAVTLLLAHGKDAPQEVRFPDNPMTVEQAEALLALANGGA